MSRIKDLCLLQAGTNDSDWGTTMAPTVKLMGIQNVGMKSLAEATVFPELRGTLAPGYEAQITRDGANFNVESLVVLEDLPYWLDGMCGQATPTTDGNGDGTYAYEAPLTDVTTDYPSPRIMTLVYGEGGAYATDSYGIPGATPITFSISGETGAAWMLTVSGIGEQVEEDEADLTLADRDVNVVMGHQTNIYVDLASDYTGESSDATQLANTGFTFSLGLESNRELLYHLGSVVPSGYRKRKWSGTLTLSLEYTSETDAFYQSIIGASAPFERTVIIEAVNGNHKAQLDFNGVVTSPPDAFTDNDGVTTVDLSMSGKYSSTMGNWFKSTVISSNETLA